MKKELYIDAVLTPADVQSAELNNICIVVDVLRASSTIVTLLSKGCRTSIQWKLSVMPAPWRSRKDCLLVGERNGIKVDGFDFGNSPFELEEFEPDGREAVLTTTNGTKAVQKVSAAPEVLIGCFLNAKACCRSALELCL